MQGNVVNSGGAVAPGSEILGIQGTYTQQASAAFDVLLAGLTAGTGYSQLDVLGAAVLDGALDITKASSFSLTDGDTFAILLAGNIMGNFSTFNYDGAACSFSSTMISCADGVTFSELESSNAIDLVVDSAGNPMSTVPLPASAPMFAAAVLALGLVGYGVKRRAAANG